MRFASICPAALMIARSIVDRYRYRGYHLQKKLILARSACFCDITAMDEERNVIGQ
jgi:hypothetical protein